MEENGDQPYDKDAKSAQNLLSIKFISCLLKIFTFLVVALMCLVIDTPAKLKKAMEQTKRNSSPHSVPEFEICVKASGVKVIKWKL